MKETRPLLYILSAIILSAGLSAFADQSNSSDGKNPLEAAVNAQVDVPSVPASNNAADVQPTYLYDLKKLIEKSKENIKEVNSKIKEEAVLKRNQQREERAREYYEKGMELTNEGKLDEARDYFEKAIRITEHPEMAGYIKDSQRRLRREEGALENQEKQHYHQIKEDESTRRQEVEQAYQDAVELYKQKKFHPAKDGFEHVNEIARQQQEAEVARAKEKQIWLQQIEEKEKEHKDVVMKQAAVEYDEAVDLYKNKKFADAKKKFEEVSWVIPDYKDTMKYLGRIDRDAQLEQERVAREQQKILQEQQWEETVEQQKLEAEKSKEQQVKDRQHQQELEDQAEFLYVAAVKLYDDKQSDEAWDKFCEIEKLLPDYKSTRMYLAKLANGRPIPIQQPPVPTPSPSSGALTTSNFIALPKPSAAQPVMSLADQEKQTQDITDLASKSAQLYQQVADIADDRLTKKTKRKLGRLEDVLNRLKAQEQRILSQMQDQQTAQERQESLAKRQEHMAQAEEMYQAALEALRNKDFEKAKIKFMALEDVVPDYKNTRRYLSHIDEDIKSASAQAVTDYEMAQAEHLKDLQDKQMAAQKELEEEAEQKAQMQQEEQEQSLEQLVQKASDLNDTIIALSKNKDYEGMKAKFTDLENTISALTTLKDSMTKEKVSQERAKTLAQEETRQSQKMLIMQKHEDREIHAYANASGPLERAPSLSDQPSDADYYKHHEVMQEQNDLFNQAVDCYEHQKYTQAKLLFGELGDQHDRRAEVWLKKVDHAITEQLLKSQEAEEHERTAFLQDQLKAQRQLEKIQDRERQRQKHLTEELERQRRLYEDERLYQLRKEEVLKTQERERQLQEAKRLHQEQVNAQRAQELRFHRVQNPVQVVSPAAAAPGPVPAVVATPTPPPAMTAQQINKIVEISNERKAFLQKQYDDEQRRKEQEDKIKAAQEERESRIKAQEDARQAKIKAAQDERERRIEEREQERQRRAELKAQEQKRREEMRRQQEEERQQRIQQAAILKEEEQRKEEMAREERERQAQLDAQRESVRKQLEDGVESMYQDAVALYNQGNYSQAADRFKDIQDILPGYKNSQQYMDEARQKALSVSPAPPAN